MQLSEQILSTDLHHAYVVEAKEAEGLAMLRALIESFGIAIKANPDFHQYVVDVFLLEHAHLLRREQSMHAADGAKKIFLVAFNSILSEAQNALLKTLEEPTAGTHFFFVTRTSTILLPTILSRVQVISPVSGIEYPVSGREAGEKFLAASVSERMVMIGEWTKIKTEEKPKAKEGVRVFLESLELALYGVLKKGKGEVARALEHVLVAKQTLSERSPSLKLLLEHLALTVPRISE